MTTSNNGNDRYIRTGIHRAVEIVEDISDDALLGLTVVHSVNSFLPRAIDIYSALSILNELFGKIIYAELPFKNDWIDHLDILDAVRINQFGRFNNVEEYYASALTGIYVVGIKKESEEHYKAIDILQKNNLSIMLVDNPLLNDHLRVNIGNIDDIDNIRLVQTINGHSSQIPLTSEQKEAVISIFELYSKDSKKKEEIKKSFESEWIKYSNLANLKSWWEKLPYSFSVTSVGKVLAHANAQRCYNNLPSLD